MLTTEEKADLEVQRSAAKVRCTELFGTISQMNKILATYHKNYYKWKDRFNTADRKLAEEDKLQVLPGPGEKRPKKEVSSTKLLISLNQAQILKVIKSLKIEIGEGGEDGD